MKLFLCFLFCWIMIAGCGSLPDKLPEILLSDKDPVVQMKFSEIADSVKVVRLGTCDSALIPEHFSLCIGERYLIACFSGGIHQFARDGEYVRRMFAEGRGPDEYFLFCSQVIDEVTGRYFMTDHGGHLFSYDLEEGKAGGRGKLPFSTFIQGVVQDTLICFPSFNMERRICPYAFFSLTPQGSFIHKLVDTIDGGMVTPVSYSSSPDGSIRLKTYKSDTVYAIDNFQKTPCYILRGEHSDRSMPLTVALRQETGDYYFFATALIQAEYNEEGKLMSISVLGKSNIYRVNKENCRSEIVDQVYVDLLETTVPIEKIQINGKYAYLTLSAFQFREILKKKMEQGQLSPELEKLYVEVKEDDNPLVLVGYVK